MLEDKIVAFVINGGGIKRQEKENLSEYLQSGFIIISHLLSVSIIYINKVGLAPFIARVQCRIFSNRGRGF